MNRTYYIYHHNKLIGAFSDTLLTPAQVTEVAELEGVEAWEFAPTNGKAGFCQLVKEVTV